MSGRTRQVRLNVPCPTWMRDPGEAPGVFALECALDELAHELGMDPLELRLRNYAETHPQTGRPWSSKTLRACYELGTERFGWAGRTAGPRSMRRGRLLVGYGMASAYYGYVQAPCQARASLGLDGVAVVRSAATDIGPGTYTVITQVAADTLGLPLDRVRFELGDSSMPPAPLQGGSGLTAALGSAVHAACEELLRSFGELAAGGPVSAGTYTAILASRGLAELSADGADVPDINVIFTGEPDPMNPIGVKGIGEVAIVGVAPAIANAVFHATGRRIRSLPITPERLL